MGCGIEKQKLGRAEAERVFHRRQRPAGNKGREDGINLPQAAQCGRYEQPDKSTVAGFKRTSRLLKAAVHRPAFAQGP